MDFLRKHLLTIVAFFVGLGVGLFYAWVVSPVQWTNTPPDSLAPQYKAVYIETAGIAYASTNNPQVVTDAFRGWTDPYGDICAVWAQTSDPAKSNVYNEMAKIVSVPPGQGCSPTGAPPVGTAVPGATTVPGTGTPDADSGPNTGVILLLILILIGLAIGIVYILRQRQSVGDDEGPSTYYDMPETSPVSDEVVNAIPLARFPSNYAYGRDNFDDSHSIENTNGDFLGECGVGIAESIGTDSPKNVTAFEVWLFDKNDIRTVTKVIMSDHAFFDDAIKAKLAPKGEPVLARENEVIVLETAALIINAEIKELKYGEGGNLPPQSYFETFTLELSAWAKGGAAPAPDVQAEVDDLLEY
jgi:hypothetical protein